MIRRLQPFLDELVRRRVMSTAAWYLGVAFVTMQVVDAVVPYLPVRDPDTTGRIVLLTMVVGFPVALALSWILEVTPPKLRRERTGPSEPVEDPRDSSRHGSTRLRHDSVAVLPFENLSDDPANEYFSDGITDDIIASVAHVEGLRVISRASVMQYKRLDRPLADIAAELGVGTVVMGSVRKVDSRIRIVAQVVDAVTDDHLWSDTYDRELSDIFQVETEVAGHIAKTLKRELTSIDRRRIEARGTTDSKAYDLYLRARFLWNQRTESAVGESIRYFERALEHDDAFTLAMSGLAEAYVVLSIYGARAPREALLAARTYARKALGLEPRLGEAVAVDACVSAIFDWSWEEADERFREALGLGPPHATAHQWYALKVLVPSRRFDEALRQLETALDLDPASSAIAASRGIVAFYARRFDEAHKELDEVVARHPRFSVGHFFRGWLNTFHGDPDVGLTELEAAADLANESSETIAALGYARARAGDRSGAEAVLRRLGERGRRSYVSPGMSAQILIGLERIDEALMRLDEAVDVRASDLVWLDVHPIYDPLRELPRFKRHLGKITGQRV